MRHRTDPESPSGGLSLFGFSAQGRGCTPSEALALFSAFFGVEELLAGKASEEVAFADAPAFLEKLVHPARSGQPFLPLVRFLQEIGRNNAIPRDQFLRVLLPVFFGCWKP